MVQTALSHTDLDEYSKSETHNSNNAHSLRRGRSPRSADRAPGPQHAHSNTESDRRTQPDGHTSHGQTHAPIAIRTLNTQKETQEQIIITGLNEFLTGFKPSRSTRRSLNRPKLFLRSSWSLLHSLIRFPSLLLSLTFPSQSSSNLISSHYCLTNGTVTL